MADAKPHPEADLPVLYSFRRCPYAMRARLALRYANIGCELREVVLRDKPPELLQLSPKATVPVLELTGADGVVEVIDESLEIMLWALGQSDPDGWLDIDVLAANMLIDANDDEFKVWLDRYKYPEHEGGNERADARQQCERFIRELEHLLGSKPALMGQHAALPDMAIVPFVRQFAMVDAAWFEQAPYPAVRAWLTQATSSQLFQSIMAKYPMWKNANGVTVF
jgi:glutathione S-transferase